MERISHQTFVFLLNKQASLLTKELFAAITANGKAADTLTEEIRRRVRDTGEDSTGGSFKPYSTKPMLTGSKNFLNQVNAGNFFKKKKLAKGEDSGWRTVKGKHLKIVPGGYKEFRRLNQRSDNKKQQVFEFSSKMWKDFKVKSKVVTSEGITIKQGMTTEQPKLEGNTAREGKSIILPNEKELTRFRVTVNNELIKLITLK